MTRRVLTKVSQQREVEDRRSQFERSGLRWTILALSWMFTMVVGAYLARDNAIAVTGIFAPIPATILAAAQVMKVRHQILQADSDQTGTAEPDDTPSDPASQ